MMKRMLRWTLFVMLVLLPTGMCLAAEAVEEVGGEKETLVKGPSESLITAFTTLIVFMVLLIVLGKSAWKPILAGLKSREEKIRKDIADAEAARMRAEATLRDYSAKLAAAEDQVREMIAKATTDAERAATAVRACTAGSRGDQGTRHQGYRRRRQTGDGRGVRADGESRDGRRGEDPAPKPQRRRSA